MFSSNMMTALGTIGVMLAYMLPILPADTPFWVKVLIGTTNAGISFLLGKTNPGTQEVKKDPPVIVNVEGVKKNE